MNEIATTTDHAPAIPDFMASAIQTFEGVQQLADLMAKCGTLPKHLQGQPADCFRVVVQACKWRMDPFAVAECTSVVHGRLCFEGKLVAAVLRSMGAIEGRLRYDVQGSGQGASITVTGTPRGGDECSLHGAVKDWRTVTKRDGKTIPNAWDSQPETMLVYRGTRQWARLYAPEAILGVYTPDEIEEVREIQAESVDGAQPKPAKRRQRKSQPTPDEQPQLSADDQVKQVPDEFGADADEAQQEQTGPTLAELDAAARLLWSDHGKEGAAAIKSVCESVGVPRLSETPEDQIAYATAQVKAARRALDAKAEKGGEA